MLGTSPSNEPGQPELMSPESSLGLVGSQQALGQAAKATLVLAGVSEEALPLEQLHHVLGPYMEEPVAEEQPTRN